MQVLRIAPGGIIQWAKYSRALKINDLRLDVVAKFRSIATNSRAYHVRKGIRAAVQSHLPRPTKRCFETSVLRPQNGGAGPLRGLVRW